MLRQKAAEFRRLSALAKEAGTAQTLSEFAAAYAALAERLSGAAEARRNTADYRLYFLDPRGELVSGDLIQAGNDVDALAEAENLAAGRSFELWRGGARVDRVAGSRTPSRR